ncbi:hypothetical protein HPP92_005546 [Vanilla planifolia]|uniref:Uncharacterized protein n=1 Tax=Vanilla planifolia TaxID=51239 RepID=A0A835RZR7_VANPL|nr:hypothetical protein HPP92_005546 [Vanilla planifolia]
MRSSDLTAELQEEKLQRVLDHLTPAMKSSLIECLIKHSQLLPVYEDKSLQVRSYNHLKRILDQVLLSRRQLASKPLQKSYPTANPSHPALKPHRQIIQTAPSNLVPVPAPIPNLNIGFDAPSPSPRTSEPPMPEDYPEDFSPSVPPDGYLEPEVAHTMPHYPVTLPEQSNTRVQKTIIIAVVVTATSTFTLAAFCFCCYNRYVGRKYENVDSQKDERPLLSLSLSDFSGSSQKSFSGGNSLQKDKFVTSSLNANLNNSDHPAALANSAEGQCSSSTDPTGAAANVSAPPPPPPPPPSLKPPPISKATSWQSFNTSSLSTSSS